ncbi:Glycine cleavage system transcriptional activator [Candidatus Terasakiella magnetica]|uniref:Glycine cleavage system transcriptional activator n=1 Tax=Candidatus Terasakiella magnetica TaxID=1867952 RepID=A0A1C3RIL3_9PROT|nr:transcriptional regulator GcvA [Candidatus Terasakiella magnetica]SCA57105.1 Glycine cleavage system transcriptional activator [Candidatus Terasakiella magnetica]
MARRLPPLNALRAFEAAARHLSFTRAADELFVTQAAVSHQVKALEEHLGLKLFKRLNRALMLTDEGQHYFPDVRDALDQLDIATNSLLKADSSGVLTVSVMPSFASLWLVPRLQQFTQQHPDIDVRIAAYDSLADFDRDDVDCAIRYGKGKWDNLYVEHIMDDEMFPVCAPHYLERNPSVITPNGLQHHTLLHDYAVLSEAETWAYWLKHANITGVDHTRGPKFSHTHMAMQACLSGEGIALGHSSMISSELQTGRLLRLFNISVSSDMSAYFVCSQNGIERFKIKVFRDWLLSESA